MMTLLEKAQQINDLRTIEASIAAEKREASAKLETAESEMLEMLHDQGMTNFKCVEGTFFISHRTSVKTPKTPEQREAFFSYLRAQGLFDSLISVNSQSLSKLYKEGLEEAKKQGQKDFNLPGITEVSFSEILCVSKAT